MPPLALEKETVLHTFAPRFDSILVLDTETSGLDFKRDEIIEIGAVLLENQGDGFAESQSLSCLVQLSPGRRLPEKITELTGITQEDLRRNGISKEAAGSQLAGLFQGARILVSAYNAQFDLNFLFWFFHRLGLSQHLKGIQMLDALTVYKDRRPYPHKLENAIAAYGLNDRAVNSHRAIDDTRALVYLMEAMEEECNDLERYINLFGYNPRYGVSGSRIGSVTYRPQAFNSGTRLYEK